MVTKFLKRIFSSRSLKLLLGAFILLLLVSQAIPQLVDSKPYVEKLAANILKTNGTTLLVKGESHLQLLPRVALMLTSAELSQPQIEHSPSVTADSVELSLSLLSLFSGAPQVSAVRAQGVSLVAEKSTAGATNWGFLGVDSLKKMEATLPASLRVEVLSGRVTVGDSKTGETYGITDVTAAGDLGQNTQIEGSFIYQNAPIQFSVIRSGVVGATPLTLALTSQNSSLSLKGVMDATADYPVVTGKIEANLADVSRLIAVVPEAEQEPAVAAPLKLTADYAQKEGLVQLSNIALDTLNSKAAGSFKWDTAQANSYALSLNFSTLDLGGVRKLVGAYLTAINAPSDKYTPKTLVNKSLDMGLDITADTIVNGAQKWSHAGFEGKLADGVLLVNKLSFSLPGDSVLSLFGMVSISDTQGLRFEGNTEAKGSSLRDLLTVFDESASNLPALGFGAYNLRSNLFVSKELLRLSEADAQFSELALKGGLVAYFDQKPRLEADVALRDINFDYFRDSWRNSSDHADNGGKEALFLRFDRNMNFDWLKKLSASIDFKVGVQGFTFLERKGKEANFRVFAQGGELGVYNAKFIYDHDATEANLKFDVTGEQPVLNLVLNTAVLNTNYFALTPAPPEPVVPIASDIPKNKEALPEMLMPAATSAEEELRQKIAEEAAQMYPAESLSGDASVVADPDPESVTPEITLESHSAGAGGDAEVTLPYGDVSDTQDTGAEEDAAPSAVDLKPLLPEKGAWNLLRSLLISDALAQETNLAMPVAAAPVVPEELSPAAEIAPENEMSKRWSDTLIDMSLMEGIGGTFDISVGTLQHKNLVFQNFKMLAKLERNLLTFQTLTFSHWGGSFSVNGTLFGGKVPGISLGFIIASVDIKQMLEALLHIDSVGGRASISGTIDTSGITMLSWISQATAKLLVAGRGVSIRGFDMASVLSAVTSSRTAADVFNNVNMAVVNGVGDYSADGAINMQKGVISTPGIALKAGRVVGNVTGDFRLVPWDVNLSGSFKFPELSTENVPTMNVRWNGAVENPTLQTDTQSLEAFVSKRITGN